MTAPGTEPLLASPPLAARLRGVKSSPVRDILALTEQPGVISFAGGLPAPELFGAPALREAFAAALADDVAGRSLQYSTTEGDPALRTAVALLAARHGARLLYTIPTFQNPTGRTLPLERREALVGAAQRHRFWLLEDDPYGELRYSGD